MSVFTFAKNLVQRFSKSAVGSRFRLIDNARHEGTSIIKVLFVVTSGQSFSAFLPVIEEMSRHKGIRLGIMNAGRIEIHFDNAGQQQLYSQHWLPRSLAWFSKWNYIFSTDLAISFPRDAIHVTTPHGAAFGIAPFRTGDYYMDIVHSPDVNLVLCNSEAQRQYLMESSRLPEESEKIFAVTGFPKADTLTEETGSPDALDFLHLPRERKTILITSHWTSNGLLRTFRGGIVETCSAMEEHYNIIVTGHYMLWNNNPDQGFDANALWQELKDIERRHKFVRVVHVLHEIPLLKVADLLITDWSSVLSEFTLLNRPILFFDNPAFKFCHKRTRDLYLGASDRFTELSDLPELCLSALSNPTKLQSERQELCRYFLQYPGQAAQRTVDVILALGEMTSPSSAKWREQIRESELSSLLRH